MAEFFKLLDLELFELGNTLSELVQTKTIHYSCSPSWNQLPTLSQICINTIPSEPDNFLLGTGSLYYDWAKSYTETFDDGRVKLIVPEREVQLKESDFNTICLQFKGTVFEEMYSMLDDKFHLGRVRIMRADPKSCLSWHHDTSKRLHYPIQTREGCFMVIEDQIKHMPKNTWWMTDTTYKHTAFNASKENRIHIVATILGEK